MQRSTLFATLLLAFSAGSVHPQPPGVPTPSAPAGLVERIDTQTAAELAKDGLGGVSVGIVQGSSLVWAKSYGLADTARKTPAANDSIYRIGSVTKMFTALMLRQLEEAGKIQLTDPVAKYFPEINKIPGRSAGAAPITLIQLATHTSGLDREPEDTETYLKGAVADWEKVLLAALPQTRFAYEPGTRFSYSNIGYAILGAALGRAAGQPYTEYVRQYIFLPLGMTDTVFELPEALRPRLATGYALEDGKVDAETPLREHQGRGYKVPNGAVYSTVADLARFVAFELGNGPEPVLKKASLEAWFEQLVTTDADLRRGYGIGFQVIRRGEAVLVGHSGGVAGYEAQMFFDRRAGTGMILLRNAVGGTFDSNRLLTVAFTQPAIPAPGPK